MQKSLIRREYEAVEVVAPTMTGDHAVLDISLESGFRTVEVIHGEVDTLMILLQN